MLSELFPFLFIGLGPVFSVHLTSVQCKINPNYDTKGPMSLGFDQSCSGMTNSGRDSRSKKFPGWGGNPGN